MPAHPPLHGHAAPSQGEGVLEVLILPALTDNYIFLLTHGSRALCIDPAEAATVERALQAHGLTLEAIWLTHHHHDHIGGAEALRARHHCPIIGFAGDTHRLPPLDRAVGEGDYLDFAGMQAEVWHLPGHTLGHIAYIFRDPALLFCGDTLFLGGCGRLFEGSAEQMFHTLQRFLTLSDDTQIYCAHEYTETNYRFAQAQTQLQGVEDATIARRLEKTLATRAQGLPTIPEKLGIERKENPFLRCAANGSLDTFKNLRQLRNQWK